MLDLTLFQIEDGLLDLYAMRQELWEEVAPTVERCNEIDAELKAVDDAIRLYIGAEIKKTDGVADFILMLDRLCHEQRERKGSVERCQIDQEIDRLKARRDSLRGVLAHVKDAVKFVMEGMSWREGKPKKLEGVRHSITLRGNGGAQPVEITNVGMIPSDLCRATVTIAASDWQDLIEFVDNELHCRVISAEPAPNEAESFDIADARRVKDFLESAKVSVEPSRSAIAEALAKPCEMCCGPGVEPRPSEACGECGGSYKRGVPGARLAERSSSVVVK